jgi:hypothetical protein
MRNTAGAAGGGFYNDQNRNTSKKQSAIKNYGEIAH